MVTYIIRRLVTAVLILLGASFVVYQLTAAAGDPLQDLRESNAPNKEQLIQQRVALLDLGTPPPLRYFKWLGGAAQCVVPFVGKCDLGLAINGEPVVNALGIITALRQYSTLDYSVTFMAFLFFSLPIFWIAVLLKEFGAIGFNDFLRNPVFSPTSVIITAICMGIVVVLFMGGTLVQRAIGFAIGAAVTAGLMVALSVTGWFRAPGLGTSLIVV